MSRIYSKIVGTGSFLPEKILTNAELSRTVDTSDAWIVERTGIQRRHIANEHETVGFMATQASKKALDAASLDASAIEMVIVATCSAETVFPSTASIVQNSLGISTASAFDVLTACAGFAYALSIADKFILTGCVKHVLVVGSEAMSRVVDWQDRSTCVLFGDGAGALVLSASDMPGILSTKLYNNPEYKDILLLDNATVKADENLQNRKVQMEGTKVFKQGVKALETLAIELLEHSDTDINALDWFIPHQANIRIIEAVAEKIGLPLERVMRTVADQGNTSAASLPLALDQGIRHGLIKPGQKILLEAVGAGFAWGGALVIL